MMYGETFYGPHTAQHHLLQVYMKVYLHIYINIYVQVAHNFDTFYATKLKFGMIFTQTKNLDFMVVLPLVVTGYIEHMQNGISIISLVLARESWKSGI